MKSLKTESEANPHQPARTGTDRAGRIEAHGIDVISGSERHGLPRELFAVWAAPNVSYLALIVGGTLTLMGLTLWQAFLVIVVGNLFSALTGLVAVSGPAAGAPSEVITRAMFGIRANRVVIAVSGWFVSVCYLALNWAAASLTGFSLLEKVGIEASAAARVLVIVTIAAATLAISVYGHATIVKIYPPLAIALATVFTIMAIYVLFHAHWDYRPEPALHGVAFWAVATAGTAVIASAPLSYNNSADFARYLPPAVSPYAVAGWTALGAFLPSVLITGLGAVAGTSLDMSDPEHSISAILPGWFSPIFLIAVILGTVANNAMTAYSSGLALQAVGIRLRRSLTVLLDGAVGVALTLYALLVSNFLDTISTMMQFLVVLLGPVMAIYSADILLRRNRYDGYALSDESKGSLFWYTGGVNLAGVISLIVGIVVALMCVSTASYTGPVAGSLGDIDLSLVAGLAVPAALYAVLMQSRGINPQTEHPR